MAVDGMAATETSNHDVKKDSEVVTYIEDHRPKLTSSIYAQDFSHKYQKRRTPIKKNAELKLPTDQMEAVTKYAEDFKAHTGHKRLACYKPVDEIQRLTGTMAMNTTSQDSFCAKQLSPRFQRQPETYKKPDLKMDCSTSYSSDFYARSEYCKLPPIRPQERKDSAKPFLASTENREQFKMRERRDGGKQVSCKPMNEYIRPSEPFVGVSSYKGDFMQMKSDRPKPIKPQGNITITGEYFGGGRVTPVHEAPPMWKHAEPLSPIAPNNNNRTFVEDHGYNGNNGFNQMNGNSTELAIN